MSDRELIARYVDGDVEAFRAFYERHKDAFHTYLRRRAPRDADDLFQDAFMKFIDAVLDRDPHRPIANPRAYLYRIGLNLVRNLGRRNASASLDDVADLADLEGESAAAPDLDRLLRAEQVQAALDALAAARPDFYDVLHLHLFEDMTFDAVSELLGVNRNTVSARYRYALQYIRQHSELSND